KSTSQSRESVKMALDTLRKNKMRSGLTILGILIGIATVILISSAINGLNSNIDHFVTTLGTNALWIYHFEPFGHRPTTEELNRKKLTEEDGMALRALPHVVVVDPELADQNFQTGLGNVSLKHGTHKIENTILQGNTYVLPHVDASRGGTRGQRDGPRPRRCRRPVPQRITDRQRGRVRGRCVHRDRRDEPASPALWKRAQHGGQSSLLSTADLSQTSS